MKLFFDFDGVLVDSNSTKTEAFRELATDLAGQEAAIDLVSFHLANPGLSRFEKLEHFIQANRLNTLELKSLADRFGDTVRDRIRKQVKSKSILRLLERPDTFPYVVSAAPQTELIEIIEEFGWSPVFRGRVYGAPENKATILSSVMGESPDGPSMFVGDSESDFKVASDFKIDFVHIYNWTDWRPSLSIAQCFFASWPTVDAFIESYLDR
jgi:phosphoglycolate phosphatase-like HAD superfamily hydrolase